MQNKFIWPFTVLVIATLFLVLAVGNATAEAFENIDEKDVAVRYVMIDIEKSFTFSNEGIDITYINISTNLTVGDVKATVESLKSTSSMVSTPAKGKVYKNINIWVGDNKLKYRLISSDVGFRVNRTWLEDNDVFEHSVKLSIYRSGGWNILPTKTIGEDDEYVYYEANTSGDLRTHFAIVEYIETEPVSLNTGEESVAEGSNVPEPIKEKPALALEGDAGIVTGKSEESTSGLDMLFFAIPVLVLLSASYVAVTKGYHVKARDRVVNFLDELQITEEAGSETSSNETNRQEVSGPTAETTSSGQVNEVQLVDIEQKIKMLEDSGILSDVVHKNKK